MPIQTATRRAPTGIYPGEHPWYTNPKKAQRFKATGEFRAPKKGERYLSGAIIQAWIAPNDFSTPYWIAKQVQMETCPTCKGTGEREKV